MRIPGTFQSPPHHPPRGARRVCTRLAGRQGLVVLGLLGLALGVLGCSDGIGGSGQCGGANNANACLQITRITPVYLEQATSNVDVNPPPAAAEPCPSGTPEPYADHNATVTILNAPLPGVGPTGTTSITLQDFSITYTLNACPVATCPNLAPLQGGQTVTIAASGSVDIILPLVPLAKKSEYFTNGGSLSAFPSYTATYLMTGTDAFNNAVSVQGSVQFTIGDFDYCP